MKILYGVQGTGNGHITRARQMAKALDDAGLAVDFVFSGRNQSDYFDLDCFKHKRFFRGMTFQLDNGSVRYFKTATQNSLYQFYQEVQSLDVQQYDAVLTDFEPVTAWASRHADVPVVGIGHQYVFQHDVPQEKPSFISQKVFDYFAPVNQSLAMHWHHFDAPILPPMVARPQQNVSHEKGKVVVYLPFENQHAVSKMLASFTDHHFIVYSPKPTRSEWAHIEFKPLSRDGFKKDLCTCDAVIANAGFELSSEALLLGKRLLVRPLLGQSEQQSNAMALSLLKYGHTMSDLDADRVAAFLADPNRVQVQFPDVAGFITQWLCDGMKSLKPAWFSRCWDAVEVSRSAT